MQKDSTATFGFWLYSSTEVFCVWRDLLEMNYAPIPCSRLVFMCDLRSDISKKELCDIQVTENLAAERMNPQH